MDGGARLGVSLLGAFRASRGAVVLTVPGARLQGLLVRLALAGGRPVEPGVLVDAIWADDPPAGVGAALQTLVSRLRRRLGSAGDVAQVTGGYRLAVDPEDVDALRFERLAATGRDRLQTGDPPGAAAALGEAVALWPGRPGAEPAVVAAVAPATATRLALVSVEAVADLADAELSLGRADVAAARLTALLTEQPVHERAAALLMDALAGQGRQAEALALFERIRETLAGTLGTDPGAALRERRLRLLRAERSVPPAGTAQSRPSNLPAPLTGLIGRDDDLARIGTLLAAGRLVTVLGPGGAGKTRLAVEAARRHQHEYRDGAWMIDLAPVTEPAKVGAAMLGAIGLRGGARPEGAVRGDDLDVLAGRLGGRESLLLVDNCEHLIDAVAHLLEALLPRCPGLRVLATSREPLAIAGEALVPLGPLALPGPGDGVEQARRTASVRLFTERAAAVRPGFGVDEHNLSEVLRVVRDLDGMPLVLELAAARLRTLSLTDLAAGLSDRLGLLTTGSRTAVPRHRTLRAVIAWSWDLLGADARTVAERISVLPGGVTPASAAAVCAGTGVPAGEILELLAGLVDRSLVQLVPDAGRYRMLSTIREYGLEGLAGPGTLDRVRNLAARYLAELVARHDPRLRGPDQLAALRVISAEYDNVLDALRHLAATGDADGAVALTLNLTWYWQMLGRDLDASSWLGQALAVPGGTPGPGRDCARAIHLFNRGTRAGVTAEDRDQLRELAGRLVAYPELPVPYGVLAALPLAFLEPAAALAVIDRPAGGEDGWLSGMARMFRAEFAENAGEIGQMRTDVEAALAGFRQAGDRWGQAAALPMRAQLRQYDGDLDGALADLSGAEALAAEFGSLSPGAQVYDDLRWSDLHRRRGEVDSALARLGAARERALRADSGAGPGVVVDVREAELRVRLGDLDRAGELLDGAGRALSFTGDHVRTLFGAVRASLALELGDRAGAKEWLAEAYALARATGDLPILAVVAVTVAALAGAYGRHHESALLVGAAARLRGTHDRSDPQVRELIRRGRAALGEDAFAIAYEKGWELDAETAVTAVDPAVLAV